MTYRHCWTSEVRAESCCLTLTTLNDEQLACRATSWLMERRIPFCPASLKNPGTIRCEPFQDKEIKFVKQSASDMQLLI